MPGWLEVVEVLVLLALLGTVCLTLLAARRRWLNRLGGTFDCSLRLRTRTPGAGWALGVGRYNEGRLEWFRFYSYSLRPKAVFPRQGVRVLQTREPDPLEAVALSPGQRVVEVEVDTGGNRELAMGSDSLTGLLAWLEASPPGVRRR